MSEYVTFPLVVASLLHLFLFVYNRYLLCLTASPWKVPLHYAWFLASVAIPSLVIVYFLESGPSAVHEALTWTPETGRGRVMYILMVALVAFFGARLLIWLQERVYPEQPAALIEERCSEAVVPSVTPALPRLLRVLDTTSDLVVTEREIAVAGLAPAFDGLTIAQVSDVHFGQRLEMENYLHGVRDLVEGLGADIVVLTGDFVDKKRDILRSVEYHAGFRGRIATLCVLGNHDYWTNPERIREAIARTHVRWLGGGERRILKRNGRRVVFTGTDAPWDDRRPDWRRLVRRDTGDAVILLSHTPDNAPAAARHGASLVLSGHTHGGQICLPLIGPAVVPSLYGLKYAGGLYRVGGDALLNVSRGVGTSSGKLRVLCRPEICLLTLRAPVVEVMVGRVVTARRLLRPAEDEGTAGGVLAN